MVISQFVLETDPEAVVTGEARVCSKVSRFEMARDIPEEALFQNGILMRGMIKLIHVEERRNALLIWLKESVRKKPINTR
jgi:hypothetical protein